MTRIVIFLGPSLALDAARTILDADYRPPAAHGDIHRAVAQTPAPAIVGLVDGYFRSVPSVRHKEILWALCRGVHVFGAASMGALRAAELADFGMVGVGQIFEAYRDGALEDDDEVAVEHAPPSAGYTPLCDPLVNIRATVGRACDESIITSAMHEQLIAAARQIFYAHRTYGSLLKLASAVGVAEAEIARLEAWLPSGRIDQKRADAAAMLARILEFAASDPAPFEPTFRFEAAEAWESDILDEFAGRDDQGPPAGASRSAILDEIRLQPGEYDELRREALTRVLAVREIRREGIHLTDEDRLRSERRLRTAHRIADRSDLASWSKENDLDESGFARLVAGEAALDRALDVAAPLIERQMLEALRASGRYPELARRAARKDRIAKERHLFAEHAGQFIPGFQLVLWFCSQILRIDPPHNVEAFAIQLGFPDLECFHRALRREYELWTDDHATKTGT